MNIVACMANKDDLQIEIGLVQPNGKVAVTANVTTLDGAKAFKATIRAALEQGGLSTGAIEDIRIMEKAVDEVIAKWARA